MNSVVKTFKEGWETTSPFLLSFIIVPTFLWVSCCKLVSRVPWYFSSKF